MARPSQPAPPVRLELLGDFVLAIDGHVVADTAWPGRRATELVQLLALTGRHRLLREEVLEALWPHLAPDAGAANLRKAAHHPRTATGRDDAVVLSGGRVALFPDSHIDVDVEELERHGQVALAATDPDGCAAAATWAARELLPERSTRSGPRPVAASCARCGWTCCERPETGLASPTWTRWTRRPTAS